MISQVTRTFPGKVIRTVTLAAGLIFYSTGAAGVDYPAQGDVAAGGTAWVENCTHCHNLRTPNELRDDQWITSIFHMRIRAGLTGKEARDILSFIQAANATAAQERLKEQIQSTSRSHEEDTDSQN